MLDTDTKRRIDTARDILVGKVPDPKSQVEQITIALIYKFMDDMDAESEELGGKRKFFTGDYARYGWARLMAPSLGGHEMLGLYGEGIAKMPENPGIPPLFRDIFKNAYLPYRDPETLKAFLKIIDEFSYDHSERLGDAFEYLLSVLGSQGDAGQFRTPRHIIDFMVEVLAPQKSETILDPACGTAGFLISAYKHILRSNTDAKGQSTLTPDDKGRLAKNFKGYDISPDMVRLSLVNLYLHGFTDPHIFEYDTLTSEERWNEFADVILANPPFMSPKGGIKPHKRFSIQAKRSEVLFVDYMAEHLTPSGRAAIIVPEGIIFQSQTAYKELRKLLVENSLVAVVSLPAGCFNPYSGVKTSILVLDKSLAKAADTIAFFKVENDGYGLGAQRRAIEKNDLPQVQAELAAYLHALRTNAPTDSISFTTGLIVPKEKLAANGDYNLSGERYRDGVATLSEFPHVTLNEVCEINPDTANPAELYPNSHFNYIDISCVENESGKFLGPNKTATDEAPSRARRSVKQGDVLMSTVRPNLKAFALLTEVPDRAVASTGFAVLRAKPNRLLPGYLINVLRDDRSVDQMIGMAGKGAYPSINQTDVESLQIPLPPLDVQKEIVAEIEGYQKVINGARAVLDHYRPHIPIHPDWPAEPLSALFATKSGTTPSRSRADYFQDGTIPWVKTLDLRDGPIRSTDEKITPQALDDTHLSILPVGTVLVAMYGGFNQIGRTGVLEIEATHNQAMTALLPTPRVSPYFLNAILVAAKGYWKTVANSTRKDPNITKTDVLNFKLPLPPLATQQAIVAEIEAEQALVAANRELIARFEQKIQATLARIWGEGEKP
ncbi:MAG: N-6 DNA methylase [Gammaproteobacteria bacterium]|nr:N-6 DNA methylase [Gammaproteobacteria bacterium]